LAQTPEMMSCAGLDDERVLVVVVVVVGFEERERGVEVLVVVGFVEGGEEGVVVVVVVEWGVVALRLGGIARG